MNTTKPLRNYLLSARRRAGLTQNELAYLLGGRGSKTVSRYELFEREPKLPTALACQAALGVPVHEIFAGVYAHARRFVVRRARVLELQLRRLPASRAVERKRATLRAIIGSDTEPASPSQS